MLKASELREMNIEELQEKHDLFKKELMHLRFQLKTGKLEKQSTIEEKKRDIARILTIIQEMKKGKK